MRTPIRCGDGDILHYCGCGPLADLEAALAGAKRLNTDLLATLPVEDASKPVRADGPARSFLGYPPDPLTSPELTPESVALLLEHRGYPGCTMASLTIRERLEVIEAAARATAPVPAEAYDPALAPEGDDPDEPHATHLRLRERYAGCPDCIRAAQVPAPELDVERLARALHKTDAVFDDHVEFGKSICECRKQAQAIAAEYHALGDEPLLNGPELDAELAEMGG